MKEKISIPNYFQGKTVFITGGSGFLGKVLIEKILRCCPDVSLIYVLLRAKKDKNPNQRVKQITEAALFDRLKIENPENIKKIIPVYGDHSKIGLGLSSESRNHLIETVNVIYNAAASVRFDQCLKDAILINTRGTREMVSLAREMKQLEVFVHISTAYTNTKDKIIQEKVYSPYVDWKEAIMLAENMDKNTLDIFTQKYMDECPNTYVFTKNMAEHVVSDLCTGQIPAIIFRPSIVVPSVMEPIAGWIDSINGPIGLLIACGKGVLRTVYGQPDFEQDFAPVDIITKALIIAAWHKAVEKDYREKLKVAVYNGSNHNQKSQSLKRQFEMCKKVTWKYPFDNVVWYPTWNVTNSAPIYLMKVYIYHLFPALVLDGILKITGNKPILLKLQRRIYVANMALKYFMTHEWEIMNENFKALDQYLVPSDKENFFFNEVSQDLYQIIEDLLLGAKKYILKEDLRNLDRAKAHIKRMYILHVMFDFAWYIGLLYFILFKMELLKIITYIFHAVFGGMLSGVS